MPRTTRAALLEEAGQYVHTDRNSNYGDPEDNFSVIAEIMSAYLSRRFGVTIPIQPFDVGNLMFAVKLGRLAHNPLHHDSYVDMAGYAAATAEVASMHDECEVAQISKVDLLNRYLGSFDPYTIWQGMIEKTCPDESG